MRAPARCTSATLATIALTFAVCATPNIALAQPQGEPVTLFVEDPRAPWFRQFLGAIPAANATVATREGADLVRAVSEEEAGFAVIPHRRLIRISEEAPRSGQMLLATELTTGLCAALGVDRSGPIETLGDLALARHDGAQNGVMRVAVEWGLSDLARAVMSTYALSVSIEYTEMSASDAAAAVSSGQSHLGVFGAMDGVVPHLEPVDAQRLRFLPLSEGVQLRLKGLGLTDGNFISPVDEAQMATMCDDLLLLRPVGVALPASLQARPQAASPRAKPLTSQVDLARGAQPESRGFGRRVSDSIQMFRDLF